MCLAVPGKIVKIEGDTATVDYSGEQREANVSLMKDVSIGDYVIVNAKFVMQKVPEDEAKKVIEVWDESDET